MNNKRQTIWLVSMLSLMVILSAYYLFTDDSGPAAPPVAESTQTTGQKLEAGTTSKTDEIVVTEVGQDGKDGDSGAMEGGGSANDAAKEPAADDKAAGTEGQASGKETEAKDGEAKAGETSGKEPVGAKEPAKDNTADQTAGTKETTKSEEDILNEVAATQAGSASGKLDSYMLERANKNTKLSEELMAKLDNQKTTPEETAKLTEQIKTLEEKEFILQGIEEQLQQQFENAVVKEENDRYNVVVLSEQMDAKRAAGIVDLVMKELKVSQDKVSVQYIAP